MSMNTEQLNTLIERYFNGETSVAEERILRDELAASQLGSPEINEARAVMGYSIAQRNTHHKANNRRVWLRAAASLAIIATLTVTAYRLNLNDHISTQCFAYVDGQRITDNDQVINMMFEGLSNVADAADESQLQAISSLEDLVSAMNQLDSF